MFHSRETYFYNLYDLFRFCDQYLQCQPMPSIIAGNYSIPNSNIDVATGREESWSFYDDLLAISD